MLKDIINNFVYKKIFKDTTINDLKEYYKKDFKASFTVFLFMSLFSALMIYFLKLSGSNVFPGIIFFVISTFGVLIGGLSGFVSIMTLNSFFNCKKEMAEITDKNFKLTYISGENKEDKEDKEEKEEKSKFRFRSLHDFINQYGNALLTEKMKSEDLQYLINSLNSAGISEQESKEILRDIISEKEDLDITLEDFCFFIKELEYREAKKNNDKKIKNTEKMLDNLFNGLKLSEENEEKKQLETIEIKKEKINT